MRSGVRHVSRALSAMWLKVLAAEHNRRAKAMRKYMRQYRRSFNGYLRRSRLRHLLLSITKPFRALWEAARSLYWRALQPV